MPTVANALKFQDFERLAMCIIRMYELMDRILDILRHSQRERQEDLFSRLAQNILGKVADSLNDKYYYKMNVCQAMDDLFYDLEGIVADQEVIRPDLERQENQKSQFMKSALHEKKMLDRKTLDCGVLNLSEMIGLGMRRLIAKNTDVGRMVFDPINFETCLREMMKRAMERTDVLNDKYLFYYINDKRKSQMASDFFKIILLEINQNMEAHKSELIHIEGEPTSSDRSTVLYEQYYVEPNPKSTLKIDPRYSNAIEVKFEDDVAVYDLQSKAILAIFQIVYKSFILDKLPTDYFRKYEGDVPQVIITTDTLYEFLNFLKGRPIGSLSDHSKMRQFESTLSRYPGSQDRPDDSRYINTSEVHRGVLDLFGSQTGNKFSSQYPNQIPGAFVESFKIAQNMSGLPQSFLQSALQANQRHQEPSHNQGMRQGLNNYIKSTAGDSIGDRPRKDVEDHERQRAEYLERMKKEQIERQEKERLSREDREREMRARAEAEKERQEKERKEREDARERARIEREEKDRLAREERDKRDREAAERREAKQKEENDRKERERIDREEKEKARLLKEEQEKAQIKERMERERLEREKRDQIAREQQEQLRKEREERLEKDRKEREEKEKLDRERREKEDKERRDREAEEKAKRDEADRLAREKREKDEKERRERLEKENQERLDREKAEREQREAADKERRLQEQKDRERRQQEEDEKRRKEEEQRLENERKDKERKEKEDRERKEKQEQEDRERKERENREKQEREDRERKEREAQQQRDREEQERKAELQRKAAEEAKRQKEEEEEKIKKQNEAKAAAAQQDDGFDDFDDFGDIDDMDDFGGSTDKKKQPESSKKEASNPVPESKPVQAATTKPRTKGDEEIEFDDDEFGDIDDMDDFGASVDKKKATDKPPSKPVTPPPETQTSKPADPPKKDNIKKNAQADEEFDFDDDFLNDDLEESKPKKEDKKAEAPVAVASQPKGITQVKPAETKASKSDSAEVVHDNPRGDSKVLRSEHLEIIDRYVTGTSPLEPDEVQDFMASLSLDHNTVSMIFNEFISNQTVFLLDFQESNEFLRIWIDALESDGKKIDEGSVSQLGRMIGQLLSGTFEGQAFDKIKYFFAPFMVVNPVANEMLVQAVVDLKNKKVLLVSLNPEIDENVARNDETDLSFLLIANIMAKCLNVAMGGTGDIEITKENLFMPLMGSEFMEFLAESCDARLPEGEEEPESPEQAYPYLRYMMINYLALYENATDKLDINGFKESLTLETFDLMNALRFVSTMRAATESLKLRTQMQHMPELANGLLQTSEMIKQEKNVEILPKLAEEVTRPEKLADSVKADLQMLKESRQDNSKVFTVLEYLFNDEGDQKVVLFLALQNNEPDVVMYLSENTEPYNTQCLDLLKPALKRDSGKDPMIFIENPRHTFATDRIDLFCCTWAILVMEVQLSAVDALRCLMYNELPFVNELMQGLMAGEEEGDANPNDMPIGMENSDERGVVEDQGGPEGGDDDFGFDDDFDADFDDEKPKAGGGKAPAPGLPALKASGKAVAQPPKGKQSNINYNVDDDLDDFDFDQGGNQGQAGGDDFDDLDF